MKKRVMVLLALSALVLGLSACGGNSAKSDTADTKKDAKSEKSNTKKITWAQGNSGNVLVSIAKDQGYFKELGLTIDEVPLDEGQLEAVTTGQVDIASNSGTWTPVQMIAAGDDMAIIGGFMLTGSMPIIAADDTDWKGPESLLGSKYGDTISRYATLHELYEQGHDLEKEIDFVDISDDDEITAIQKGELDYAVIGTGKMYQVQNTKGIKIVDYCSDITPNYSCCRMVARDSWVKKNPETVKLLNEALIRAQAYFEANREKCVGLMAEQLGTDKEYVEAYMLNEHYRINPDTVKNTVMDNYKYMKAVGGIDQEDKDVKLEDRIYSDLYKEALDDAVEKYSDEDPEFYKNAVTFYEENNL
ncbi:ABC transporter substrate-binding protein [Enterococcus malodoratus]|uniref:ABC transporter substrate-binding protein n=1 Tax=Enterococcus malodoratus TaxID=71451 RepID=UPI003FD58F9F